MMHIFTRTSSSSSRRAVAWAKENGIDFEEHRINVTGTISEDFVRELLSKTENGFYDLLNQRYRKEYLGEIDGDAVDYEGTTSELIEKICNKPNMLTFPIIQDGDKVSVGFSETSIRMFVPHEMRAQELRDVMGPGYIKVKSTFAAPMGTMTESHHVFI